MKKRVVALLTLVCMLVGLLAVAKPVTAEAATGKLQAGYAAVNIDPLDKAGTYRAVDYTEVLEGSGNATLKNNLAKAGVTLEKPVYTVPTLSFDCDGDGNKDDGYFAVPLAGYGTTYERMSQGKVDDNGDGKINNLDGMKAICIAVTNEQGNTMLFFSLDLIAANNAVVADAKALIQQALKEKYGLIPQDHMTFTASHSHSSPDTGLDNSAPLNSNAAQRAYLAMLKDRLVEAAKAAMADRCEATVTKGEVQATKMNSTRHYNVHEEKSRTISGVSISSGSATWVYGDNFGRSLPSDVNVRDTIVNGYVNKDGYKYIYEATNVSEADNTVHLVQFTPTDGDAPIVMVNFRAHPKLNSTATTRYGLDNRYKTSADYTAPLREKMEKYGYRGAFFQGAAGNQNTWNYIDDGLLAPKATNTYSWMTQRHTTDVTADTTQGCRNDRMSFIKYTSPTDKKTYNLQTGYSYGFRLADYVLNGLEKNMKAVSGTAIKSEQYFFTAAPQVYSAGLKAAVASYDAATGSAKTFPYKYLHTDGKYYNLNSVYHANSVRSRNNDATLIDAKLELNCITIGDMAFVTAPNELYDRYNLSGNQTSGNLWDNLKDEGFGTPVFLGYTNGSEGYIPNVAAYEYNRANNDKGAVAMINGTSYVMGVGAYEANTSKFAPGAGEALCQTFETMLKKVKTSGRSTTCPMCGQENVVWEALSDPEAIRYDTGHYFLADDLNKYASKSCFQKTIYTGESVCIDLNGHTIQNASNVTGRAFYVSQNATLRLMNGTVHGRGLQKSADGGVILVDRNARLYLTNVDVIRDMEEGQTTGNGGAIYVYSNASLVVEGGSITGGATNYSGGAISAGSKSNITLNNTTVTGGKSGSYGGAIYANSNATVTIRNSTIVGGSAKRGGAIYGTTGTTVNLENVTVKGGTASEYGGCIYSNGKLTVTGGSVSGGKCTMGGGVYLGTSGTLTLSGSASVTGNKTADSATANNILAAAEKLTLAENYSGTAGIVVNGAAEGKEVARYNGADLSKATLTVDGQEKYYNFVAADGIVKLQRTAVVRTGWVREGDTWYYYNKDVLVTGWFAYGPYWYYMDGEGVMQSGWLRYGGKWYFFDHSSGRMVTSKWVGDEGKWYYFDANGHMLTGWLEQNGVRYYLKPDGAMATGYVTIDGKQHSFDDNGIWKGEVGKSGWFQEGGKWYYYQNGSKKTGWLLDGKTWYYLKPTGEMQTGWLLYGKAWYYMDASGAMVTGSRNIGGKVYNFDANGVCLNP